MSTYTYTEISCTTPLLPLQRTHIYQKPSIGGAGNYRKHPTNPNSNPIVISLISPPKTTTSTSPSQRTSGSFSTGIGGAGNVCSHEERASISREEEGVRRSNAVAERFHYGIGGRGNRVMREGSGSAGGETTGKGCRRESVSRSNADKLKSGFVGLFGRGQ